MRSERLISVAHPLQPSGMGIQKRLVGFILVTILLAVLQTWAGAQSSTAEFRAMPSIAIALGVIWVTGAFIIGLSHPELIVCAMAFFTFFTAWRPIDLPIGSFQASQLLAVVVVVLVVGGLTPRRFRPKMLLRRKSLLSLPLLALLAVVTLATIHTAMLNVKTTQGLAIIRQGRADPLMRGLTAMAALISGMCAFLAVKRVLKDTRLINLALKSWIMGAICTILVGGYQFAHYYVHALPGLPLTAALGVRGLGIADRDVTATGQSSEFMIRMASFAMEPRHLAYLLTPVLCFLLVYLLGSPDLTRSTRRKTLLVTGLIIIGFGLTASRSTYILGIVAFGVTLWGARRRLLTSAFRIGRSLVLLGLGTALILGTLAMITGYNPLEFVRLQLASLAQVDNPGSGVPYGIDAFVLAWLMFKSNPFIGAGWGSYVYAVQKYPLAFALQANPNNLYLLMLGETGLIGLCALLWVFWRGLRMSHISLPAARKHAPLLAALGAALLATYAGFMFWDSIQYTHLWMLLGLMQAARRAAIREPLCA